MFSKVLMALMAMAIIATPAVGQKAVKKKEKIQIHTVTLTANGYQPEKVKLRRGIPARITFIRKFEATCATEVIISKYKIKKELPMNEEVVIEFTPDKSEEIDFTCSMKMVGGKIQVN